MRITLYFLLIAGIFFAFFYFYPANIFQAEVKGAFSSLTLDVSLQTLFFKKDLPSGLIASNISSISLTVQGWFLLIICLVGIPLMLAYRFGRTAK